MAAYEVLSSERDRVGESPVWSLAQQALYWVDIEGRQVRRCRPGSSTQSWVLPERVGCIALAEDGRVIAAMESGIAAVTLQEAGAVELEWLARIDHPVANMRFNDGRCDAAGRLWVGTMVMDMSLASTQGRPLLPGRARPDRPLCQRSDHAQRPGLQPRPQDDLPVRLPPPGAEDLGLRLRPRERHAVEPPPVRRHEPAAGPSITDCP